jgi:hypothetical protein
MEFSTGFAGDIGQYIRRVYTNMAVEMFGKKPADVAVDTFELTDAELAAYDPTKFFTSTELTDTVPPLNRIFTEDQLVILREGIPVTSLPNLQPWPLNLTDAYSALRPDGSMGDAAATGGAATTGATTGASGLAMPTPTGP